MEKKKKKIHLPVQDTQETQVQSLVWKIPSSRKWQPTLIFLPEKSHGKRSVTGYSPWDCKQSDMTEQLSTYAQTRGIIQLKTMTSEELEFLTVETI